MAGGSVFAMWRNGELFGASAASCAAMGLGYLTLRMVVEGAIGYGVTKASERSTYNPPSIISQTISGIAMTALIVSSVLALNLLHGLKLHEPLRQLTPLALGAAYAGLGAVLALWPSKTGSERREEIR